MPQIVTWLEADDVVPVIVLRILVAKIVQQQPISAHNLIGIKNDLLGAYDIHVEDEVDVGIHDFDAGLLEQPGELIIMHQIVF